MTTEKQLELIKHDVRLQGRRGSLVTIDQEQLRLHLEQLPDVSHKAARPESS